MAETLKHTQLIGMADAPKDQMRRPEAKPSPEQTQFFNRYQAETKRAYESEKQANQHARDRMKGLSAIELRRIGAKQMVWGFLLSPLNVAGMALGTGIGGWGTWAALSAVGASGGTVLAGAVAMGAVGYVAGAVGGSELTRVIYEKVARKFDTSLPPLDQNDRLVGDVLSLTGTWTPPMIAGARNLFDGFNSMKAIK